jgi:hypothetical protein
MPWIYMKWLTLCFIPANITNHSFPAWEGMEEGAGWWSRHEDRTINHTVSDLIFVKFLTSAYLISHLFQRGDPMFHHSFFRRMQGKTCHAIIGGCVQCDRYVEHHRSLPQGCCHSGKLTGMDIRMNRTGLEPITLAIWLVNLWVHLQWLPGVVNKPNVICHMPCKQVETDSEMVTYGPFPTKQREEMEK